MINRGHGLLDLQFPNHQSRCLRSHSAQRFESHKARVHGFCKLDLAAGLRRSDRTIPDEGRELLRILLLDVDPKLEPQLHARLRVDLGGDDPD